MSIRNFPIYPHQRRYTDGKRAYGKIFHFICDQENANKNNEIPLHTYQNGLNPEYRQHQMLARMQSNRNFHSLPTGMQNVVVILKNTLAVSYKLNVLLSCDPAVTLWYLPKGVENMSTIKIYTGIFTAAQFIIAQIWKQRRYSSQVNVYMVNVNQTVEHSSQIKERGIKP